MVVWRTITATRLKRRHAWQLAQQKQELAEQASQAKTRFLATLGHEVRTPMTGVLGMSELLLGTPLNPQQRGYVGAIRGAGEHLLRLVNDALDLARIESGKLELADEVFDLHALVEELAALIGPLAKQRGLAFELSLSEDVRVELARRSGTRAADSAQPARQRGQVHRARTRVVVRLEAVATRACASRWPIPARA